MFELCMILMNGYLLSHSSAVLVLVGMMDQVDAFIFCGWKIQDEKDYKFAQQVIKQEKAWHCRIPMSKDEAFHLPITIPLWGVVEPSHIHINFHLNFALHAMDGYIIGASVYPGKSGVEKQDTKERELYFFFFFNFLMSKLFLCCKIDICS